MNESLNRSILLLASAVSFSVCAFTVRAETSLAPAHRETISDVTSPEIIPGDLPAFGYPDLKSEVTQIWQFAIENGGLDPATKISAPVLYIHSFIFLPKIKAGSYGKRRGSQQILTSGKIGKKTVMASQDRRMAIHFHCHLSHFITMARIEFR